MAPSKIQRKARSAEGMHGNLTTTTVEGSIAGRRRLLRHVSLSPEGLDQSFLPFDSFLGLVCNPARCHSRLPEKKTSVGVVSVNAAALRHNQSNRNVVSWFIVVSWYRCICMNLYPSSLVTGSECLNINNGILLQASLRTPVKIERRRYRDLLTPHNQLIGIREGGPWDADKGAWPFPCQYRNH